MCVIKGETRFKADRETEVAAIQEEEILKKLRRGDPAALEALMDRYTPYVSAIAARVLPGQPREWEEIISDVFLAAWDNRRKLQTGRVKGWLAVTTRNRAINRLRILRPEELPLEEEVLTLTTDHPQRELEAKEAARLVRQALDTLSREDRELFVRRYYYGQTVTKAAEEMGLNESTAKSRLRRGRERLKEYFRKAGYEFETD